MISLTKRICHALRSHDDEEVDDFADDDDDDYSDEKEAFLTLILSKPGKVTKPTDLKSKGRRLTKMIMEAIPFLINLYSLHAFTLVIPSNEIMHYAFVAYVTMIFFGFVSFSHYLWGDMMLDLTILLDYAQLTLVPPLLAAEVAMRYNAMEPNMVLALASAGVPALLFFILMEYRRPGLADLAIIPSVVSLLVMGVTNGSVGAVLAAVCFCYAYFWNKRNKGYCVRGQCTYDLFMALGGLAVAMS
ncbi:unnamed protein product [Callosobruchus maculatus]|uniref:Uncharacterized protein n=1 Tax=Callosobruchus maculatus TaxID=64391 RepID=A0A653C7I6_CALMS|nr:unnamed protein product [Callosobruchus maculatus]